MKMSKKTNAFFRGFSSAFDISGKSLQKRDSAEDNIYASWHNVGVHWSDSFNTAKEGRKAEKQDGQDYFNTF